MHCLHARSPHADATPLVLIHGWPGSIVEFLDVIPRLTHPEDHGGDPADAMHVVAPSLPGYGFSGPTREKGWDPARIARRVRRVHGAARVRPLRRAGRRLGGADRDAAAGAPTPTASPCTRTCRSRRRRRNRWTCRRRIARASRPSRDSGESESGYAIEQSTKPQTVGVALNDSPAGLLAWIVEKFRNWSDCDGVVESVFPRDRLLTNVMVYWVTGTITSSARLYWELRRSADTPAVVRVPDRDRAVPRGDPPVPAAVGRAAVPRHVLERASARRALRGDGTTGALRRRPARVRAHAGLSRSAHRRADTGPATGEVELLTVAADRRAVDEHVAHALG